MRKPMAVVLLLFCCATCLGQIGGLSSPNLVRFHMVLDTEAIAPGKAFRVGLVYDVTPGWHIYWVNPGDAGLATSVKLHLPAGFSAEPIVFPVPTQFVMPGGIICYGYHSQLMLIATVTPPADLKAEQQVNISADTNYLVCENVCIGGKQSASNLFPVGVGSGPRNVELFNHWASLVPIPAAKSPIVKSIDFDDSSVTISWNEPVKEAAFFPGASSAVAIAKITTITQGKQTQVLFVPKYYDKTKLSPISCVVGFIDSHGVHRAIEFPVTLKGT